MSSRKRKLKQKSDQLIPNKNEVSAVAASVSRRESTRTTKKRQTRSSKTSEETTRNKSSQETMVVEIDGVSADVSTLLIEAVKAQKKFLYLMAKTNENYNYFQNYQNVVTRTSSDSSKTNSHSLNNNIFAKDDHNNNNINDTILSRMERNHQEIKDHASMNDCNQKQMINLYEKADQLMNALLKRLDQEKSSKTNWRKNNEENTLTGGDNEIQYYSTAVYCLIFIIDIIENDSRRNILRYAALSTASSIIEHRDDCQRFILNYNLKNLIDSIPSCTTNTNTNNGQQPQDEQKRLIINLMQREMLQILNLLSTRLKDSKQPKLIVAIRYMEDQRGISTEINTTSSRNHSLSSVTGTTPMWELRHIRDIALRYGTREYNKVEKILILMDECFEILVPRFGFHYNQFSSRNMRSTDSYENKGDDNNYNEAIVVDADDGDDDDIDWEDGDNEEDLFIEQQEQSLQTCVVKKDDNYSDHIAAVETTLAMMKETGALTSEGRLNVPVNLSASNPSEINFEATKNKSIENANIDNTNSKQVAREKIEKCVKILSTRHLPRLKAWVDALISADNMTYASSNRSTNSIEEASSTSATVLLPLSIRKKKAQTLNLLSKVENDVTRALASAAKFGMTITTSDSDGREQLQSNGCSDEIQNNPNEKHEAIALTIQKDSSQRITWQQALGIASSQTKNDLKDVKSSSTQRGNWKKIGKSKLKIKLRNSK